MKRSADKQLTKDGPDNGDDDDEIQEIQDPQGFQQADEAALAKRQIRALPKRALAASRPPALNGLPPAPASDVDRDESPQPSKFGAFVGFGAATNSFTFTSQQPHPSLPVSDSPFLGAPKQLPADPGVLSQKNTVSAEETDAAAFKYFKCLRGLNVSFLSAISTAVEKDPFCDVASLVESYKNLRTTIQSEFDGASRSSATRAPVAANSTPIFGVKTPSENPAIAFSMPKPPPTGFAEPSLRPTSTGENVPKTTGFAFSPFAPPAPTQLPFGLTSNPRESSTSSSTTLSEPPKSAFQFPAPSMPAATSSLPPISSFTFAIPSATENAAAKPTFDPQSLGVEESATALSSQPPLTAPVSGSGSSPSIFGIARPTSSDVTSKPASVFGSPIFGSTSIIEANKQSPFNPSSSDSKDGSKVATVSSTQTSIFASSSDKPVSSFGSATQPKTGVFTFGKPGGSIGNPVGFGFGSSSGTGDGSSTSGSIFAVPSTKPSDSLFSPSPTDKSSESTPQPEVEGHEEGGEEDASKLLPSQSHDGEGEGEEDEETTHVVKCKVFRLAKSEAKSEWKDFGIGMLRLKKHKETHVRRVLMRNSNTGRILINFRVNATLKPSLIRNVVSFIGYENSMPTSFRIRIKTEEQAVELKQAMEREIAAVQAAE